MPAFLQRYLKRHASTGSPRDTESSTVTILYGCRRFKTITIVLRSTLNQAVRILLRPYFADDNIVIALSPWTVTGYYDNLQVFDIPASGQAEVTLDPTALGFDLLTIDYQALVAPTSGSLWIEYMAEFKD